MPELICDLYFPSDCIQTVSAARTAMPAGLEAGPLRVRRPEATCLWVVGERPAHDAAFFCILTWAASDAGTTGGACHDCSCKPRNKYTSGSGRVGTEAAVSTTSFTSGKRSSQKWVTRKGAFAKDFTKLGCIQKFIVPGNILTK